MMSEYGHLFIYFSVFVYICDNSDVNVHDVKLFRIKLELELEYAH